MHIELQQTMQHLLQVPEWDMEAMVKEVSRFTPVDFRMGIQWLVAQDKPDLAQALAEAGLSLFPESEDILAISGLLSMSRQDWCLAVELLQDLIAVQKEPLSQTQIETLRLITRQQFPHVGIATIVFSVSWKDTSLINLMILTCVMNTSPMTS
jgi:hypothetical protein